MNELVSKNPIVTKIADGTAKEDLLEMLVARQLPFTEEEYLESFVLALKNENFKARAIEQLKQISESTKSNYIERIAANHRVAYFVLLEALNWKYYKIINKVCKNQALPFEFLVKIGEKGDNAMLEALIDNQVKLIAYPEIIDAIEKNPEASNFVKGKIKEIRDFYLSQEGSTEIKAEDVIDDMKEALAMEQKKTSQSENGDESLDDENDMSMFEKKALTTLQEINSMSISERVKLAFSGSKTHRMILVKDPNKMVMMAVIESPKLTGDEVLLIARNKSMPSDAIARIAKNREWVKNYSVVQELVQNPKTPIKEALAFLNKLHITDLKLLAKNKNANPVIRQVAQNSMAQKVEKK